VGTSLKARLARWRLPLPSAATVLTGVIAAGLLISPNPAWAMLFYVTVLPLFGLRLRTLWPEDVGGLLGVALILWFTVTTLWDHAAGARAAPHLLWVWNGLCTLVFFLAARASYARAGPERERLYSVLIIVAAINVAVSVGRATVIGMPEGRMNGWAEARHPILGAAIIGVCVILAAARALHGRSAAGNGAVACAGLAFIIATGSRGPLIAVAAALGVLLIGLAPRLLLALAGAVLALALIAYFAVPGFDHAVGMRYLARGWSNRLDIWDLALREIAARPLFGHGPTARLARAVDNFPHNLFLSTLFYSGVIGLVLLLALLVCAVLGAVRAKPPGERYMRLALLANLVLTGLSDLSQVTKGPSPMWYIVWLPIVLALPPPDGHAHRQRAPRLRKTSS
jgi:O-antigen ligase